MTSLPSPTSDDRVTVGIDVAKATLEVAISGQTKTLWLATITLAGRRQLSWRVLHRRRAGPGSGVYREPIVIERRFALCPARRSRTTKCRSTSDTA